MPTTTTDAATVAYAVTGSGPPLVLVHGTGIDAATNWGHLVDRLARDRTVISPDFAGSGSTVDHGRRLSLDALADQVVAAADAAVGDVPFRLLGYSLGAAVAATVAARRPPRLEALALVAGWVSSSDDARAQLQFRLWQQLSARDHRLFAQLMVLSGFSARFTRALTVAELEGIVADASFTVPPGTGRQAELNARVDVSAILGSITVPTHVIGCSRDNIVPVEQTRALRDAIPDATYAEIDSGHFVMFEQPELLLAEIESWTHGTAEKR